MHYGVVDENNELVHYVDVPLPGPAAAARHGVHRELRHSQRLSAVLGPRAARARRAPAALPPRHAVALRRDPPPRRTADDIRWFEADPTFVLHFTNAYEDGDEIVLDGFFEGDPEPGRQRHGRQVAAGVPVPGAGPAAGPAAPLAVQPRHRRRARGAAVRQHHRVRHDQPRATPAATTATPTPPPASRAGSCSTGWSSTTCTPAPRSASRSATASTAARPRWRPRVGCRRCEDDGYLVTLTTDMNDDASYCLVFDAARVADGPVCKLALPERISSGTHSTWAPGFGVAPLACRPTPPPRRSACSERRCRPTPLPAGGVNAVGRMLGLLGDEWTLLIVQQALLGATRYGEFTARLPISNAVLTPAADRDDRRRAAGPRALSGQAAAVRIPARPHAAARCGRCCCRSGSGNAAGCPTTPSRCPRCATPPAAPTSRRC